MSTIRLYNVPLELLRIEPLGAPKILGVLSRPAQADPRGPLARAGLPNVSDSDLTSASQRSVLTSSMSGSRGNTRILVTGGAGFVGSTIVLELLAAHPSWSVTVLDVKRERDYKAPARQVQYIRGDVRNASDCHDALRKFKPTLIIHAAGVVPGGLARYSHKGRDEVFALNVGGTQQMLKATKAHGVKHFIFTGSCTSVTDDLDHDYPNFREEVSFPKTSLVYGESKVSLQMRSF